MTDTNDVSSGTHEAGREQAEGVTRREFMATIVVAGTFIGTAVAFVNAVVRYLIPPAECISGVCESIEVATTAELPDGTAKSFLYSGVPCSVINVKGQIRGFSRVCTHLQCAIDWDGASGTFLCPCHAAVFDNNGAVVSGPAPKPLPRLKIDVKNGKVFAGGWA